MIVIRNIDTIEEFKETAAVQKSAWGFEDIQIQPHHFMTRIRKYGGIVQGLFADGELTGFTLATLGKWQGEFFIYSHMTAVKKEYQGRGYGFLLKKAQGEEAKKMGYRLICWCFDPLEAQNSFFNIHRLGVLCREYERDVYGEGQGALQQGLVTDRLIALWDFQSDRVTKRMKEKFPENIEKIPVEKIDVFNGEVAYIEIPRDIRIIKKENIRDARDWRKRTRRLFETAFQKGFTAEEIVFSEERKRIFYKLTNYHRQ